MAALAALEQADQSGAAIIKEVQTTINNAQTQGNRDPTPEERAALDAVIASEMKQLDS